MLDKKTGLKSTFNRSFKKLFVYFFKLIIEKVILIEKSNFELILMIPKLAVTFQKGKK